MNRRRDRPPPLAARLLTGALYTAALIGGLALITLLIEILVLRYVLSMIFWLGGSLRFYEKFRTTLSVACVICGVGPVVGIMMGLNDVIAAERGGIVEGISVAAAPQHTDAYGFVFSDAVLQRGYSVEHREESRDQDGRRTVQFYYAAPLTPPSWVATDPVPAWAGCMETTAGACAGWRDVTGGASAVIESQREGVRTAADQVLRTHGLREATGAPLLELTADPRRAFVIYRRVVLLLVFGPFVLWVAGVLGQALLRRPAQHTRAR